MKQQILKQDETIRRLRDEAQHLELREMSPELCLSPQVVTFTHISPFSTDEK